MRKGTLNFQLLTVQYPWAVEPAQIADPGMVFELGAKIQGRINVQAKANQALLCEQVQLTLSGRISGSKVQNEEFLANTIDVAQQVTFDGNTQSVPFTIVLDFPASSFSSKKGAIEYQLIGRCLTKGQILVEQKQPISFRRTSQLLTALQAPLIHVISKPQYTLVVRSDQSLYTLNSIVQGTMTLQGQQQITDVDLKLFRIDQYNQNKEQSLLGTINLTDCLKPGEEIPFCLPLAGFQIASTLNFQQIFIQTRLGFSYSVDQKREDSQIEIIIKE